MFGKEFTVTLLTAWILLTQPKVFVPLTEYDVFAVGLTTADPPEKVYVLAPDGIIVKDCPAQIAPLFTVMIGDGFTVMVLTAGTLLTQPSEFVPLTE